MRQTSLVSVLLLFVVFSSDAQDFLSKSKQVATKKGELIVCDRSLLKETITIPLSELAEELQIVKLDDADEALVSDDNEPLITENFIFVRGGQHMPYKLFDKKTGKFLTNIGAYGQGPGEYQDMPTCDKQVDEENDRIYLLFWFARQILVYDLKGKNLPPIPLYYSMPKGNFKVDTKAGTVIVSALPFAGANPAIVWQQTTNGELLKSVDAGHLAVPPNNFDNDVNKSGGYRYSFHVYTFVPRIDSVYHYDVVDNKIIPVFTMNFKSQDLTTHNYVESKNYFMGDFVVPVPDTEHTSIAHSDKCFIIDKNTLKGAFFVLENDFLGGMVIERPIFSIFDEYYCRNADPGNLKDELEEFLKSDKKLSPEMKAKLTKLKDSITDNDNNYILYAKLKR